MASVTGKRQVIKAMAVVRRPRDGALLVSEPVSGSDPPFQRPLGGHVEFGEYALDTVRREFGEEIGQELTDVRLLGVLENIFTLDGIDRHEIVFVFDAQFADAEWRARTEFAVNEAACIAPATWVPLASLGDHGIPVYPRDLVQLLA